MKMYQGLLAAVLAVGSMSALAQSGCCSWHGGVDYCGADGNVYCRDGTQSPSCTCNPHGKDPGAKTNNDDDRAFKLFSSRDMTNPNPYLEPFVAKWSNKRV